MLSALLLFLLFQSPNADLSIEERYRVEFVLLDIVALDRKNNLVTDLTLDEFEIEENGRKVEITYFDTLDFRNLAEPDLEDIPVEYQEQVKSSQIQQIIIAVDLFETRLPSSIKTRDRLLAFIRNLEEDLDYRINVFSLEHGSLTGGFVQDRERVQIAIKDMHDRHMDNFKRKDGDYRKQELGVPWDGAPRQSKGRASVGPNAMTSHNGFADYEKSLESCGDLYRNDPEAWNYCIDSSIEEFIDRVTHRTNAVIGQLEILTYAFEDLGGLKTMLFISPGFALENISSAVELAELYRPRTGEIPPISAAYTQVKPENDFRRVAHACIKNRVIFHTFDIFYEDFGGQRTIDSRFAGAPNTRAISGAYRGYASDVTQGLVSLADESGGSFTQSARLEGPMTEVLRRNRFFYVIGYTSPIGDEVGEFREIEVDVNRRRVKVRHRTGYFAGVDKRLK